MKSFLQEGEEGDDYGHVSDYLTKAALQLQQDTDKEGAERGGDSNFPNLWFGVSGSMSRSSDQMPLEIN